MEDFKEEEHPREANGRFTKKGNSALTENDKDVIKRWSIDGNYNLPIERVEEIEKVLEKLPSYKGTIYRGESFNENEKRYLELLDLQVGESFISNCIASWSKNEEVAKSFTFNSINAVLLIKDNTTGKDISNYAIEEEEEVLNKRTSYKCIDKFYENDILYIELEETEK